MKTIKHYLIVFTGCIFLVMISCQNTQEKEELQSYKDQEAKEAENIQLVRNFYRLLDEVKLDSLDEIYADAHQLFYQSAAKPAIADDMKPFVEMFYNAFPDYTHHIDNIFAAGDKVVALITYTGTHQNTFMELEPTGNNFEYKGIFVFELMDGKISKFWGVEDELTMMRQLGLELR